VRLLLVTNDYPPKPGGIQMYLGNLVSAYPDDVLVFGPADDAAPDGDPGVVRGSASYMVPTKRLAKEILAVAEPFAPDAILFGAPHPLPRLGPILREALGVPFGVLSHGAEVTLPAAMPGSRQLLAHTLRQADVRFAVSRFTADRVERLTGRQTDFIGAGVEIDTFVPSSTPATTDRPVIGCVSRFVPRKGQDRLIEAVARLDEDVEVLLVGKGRKEDSLRKLAHDRGVKARFAVDVPWRDLPGLYQQMDIFCMPTSSRWGGLEVEGLGLVYLEAAATGLPVLAGDSGGSPETVLPGRTGFVVAGVEDIVDGLGILLADPVRAAEMGAAGRAFVESEFTWDRVVERLLGGFAPHLG
jgi:phosphatidylinositol alpha-1,6-mannosyltransferase